MSALAQVPDVERVAVLAAQQQLRVDAVLHHVRRAPLAGDHRVVAEVPPEVVGQLLLRPRSCSHAAPHLERLVIEHEDAAGAVAVCGARARSRRCRRGRSARCEARRSRSWRITSSPSITFTRRGFRGSGFVSRMWMRERARARHHEVATLGARISAHSRTYKAFAVKWA